MRPRIALLCFLFPFSLPAFSATYQVTTNVDGGPGSFRQAILDANGSPGTDRIVFNLSGTLSIQPTSALPPITDPIDIDGTTQPGFSGKPLVEISGIDAGEIQYYQGGLYIQAPDVTIRSLIINRFRGNGVSTEGARTTIVGCYIGINAAGTLRAPNQQHGILVLGSAAVIGGQDSSLRNVISGNGYAGIQVLGGSFNKVEGNYIGTSASGSGQVSNWYEGIVITSSSGGTIGGTSSASRNVIVGTHFGSIHIDSSSNVTVQGNLLNIDTAGNRYKSDIAAPNVDLTYARNCQIGGTQSGAGNRISSGWTGLSILDSTGEQARNRVEGNEFTVDPSAPLNIGLAILDASGNRIGGSNPGAGNTFNGVGIQIKPAPSQTVGIGTGNLISRNSIYSTDVGIALFAGEQPIPANDSLDADDGSNNLQNYPVISSARVLGNTTVISGFIDTYPAADITVEFFSNSSCGSGGYGLGRNYLGDLRFTTNSQGHADFTTTISQAVPTNQMIAATATDSVNNTSVFSKCSSVVAGLSDFSFESAAPSVSERGEKVALTIVRSGAIDTTATVSYATSGGTATPASDYVFASGSLTFAPGETRKTFDVTVLNDDLAEGDQTIEIPLSVSGSLTGVKAVVTIRDDEPLPEITVTRATVTEGDLGTRDLEIDLRLSLASERVVRVNYASEDGGDATVGIDYEPVNGLLTFPSLERNATIRVPVVGDTKPEPDETFFVRLFSAENLSIPNPRITCTIVDDDEVSLRSSDVSVLEGNSGTTEAVFTVALQRDAPRNVSVNYVVSSRSATIGEDLQALSGTLVFAPGEREKQIRVMINGDTQPEGDETFSVDFSNAVGATLTTRSAIGTIINDDPLFELFSRLEYAISGGESLKLNLRVPFGPGPFPLIVWVSGDGWVPGDTSAPPALRQADRGYAVTTVDYLSAADAGFPSQVEELKAAIRWLRANASRYRLDANRIGVWGAGSGGHLASLIGTAGDIPAFEAPELGNAGFSSRVQVVIDWFAPIDLSTLQSGFTCTNATLETPYAAASRFLGCAPSVCPETAAQANPLTYLSPDDPAFLIMHGTNDCMISPDQSERFAESLRNGGIDTTLFLFLGAGHGGALWESSEIRRQVDEFLDAKLRDRPTPPRRRPVRP